MIESAERPARVRPRAAPFVAGYFISFVAGMIMLINAGEMFASSPSSASERAAMLSKKTQLELLQRERNALWDQSDRVKNTMPTGQFRQLMARIGDLDQRIFALSVDVQLDPLSERRRNAADSAHQRSSFLWAILGLAGAAGGLVLVYKSYPRK